MSHWLFYLPPLSNVELRYIRYIRRYEGRTAGNLRMASDVRVGQCGQTAKSLQNLVVAALSHTPPGRGETTGDQQAYESTLPLAPLSRPYGMRRSLIAVFMLAGFGFAAHSGYGSAGRRLQTIDQRRPLGVGQSRLAVRD